jgi:hypothetical protein
MWHLTSTWHWSTKKIHYCRGVLTVPPAPIHFGSSLKVWRTPDFCKAICLYPLKYFCAIFRQNEANA